MANLIAGYAFTVLLLAAINLSVAWLLVRAGTLLARRIGGAR